MADFAGDMESSLAWAWPPAPLGRNSAARMFASFLVAQHEKDTSWPSTADELTEEQANSPALYERYAFYLANVVESGRGGGALALGSAKNYLRAAGQDEANGRVKAAPPAVCWVGWGRNQGVAHAQGLC